MTKLDQVNDKYQVDRFAEDQIGLQKVYHCAKRMLKMRRRGQPLPMNATLLVVAEANKRVEEVREMLEVNLEHYWRAACRAMKDCDEARCYSDYEGAYEVCTMEDLQTVRRPALIYPSMGNQKEDIPARTNEVVDLFHGNDPDIVWEVIAPEVVLDLEDVIVAPLDLH